MSKQLLLNCFQLFTVFLADFCPKFENKVGRGELADIEFLNKLEWKDYKDFLKGKIAKDSANLIYRIITISYFIKDVPISEEDLKNQIKELLENSKKTQKSAIPLCQEWLDKLNSGLKVKDL